MSKSSHKIDGLPVYHNYSNDTWQGNIRILADKIDEMLSPTEPEEKHWNGNGCICRTASDTHNCKSNIHVPKDSGEWWVCQKCLWGCEKEWVCCPRDMTPRPAKKSLAEKFREYLPYAGSTMNLEGLAEIATQHFKDER